MERNLERRADLPSLTALRGFAACAVLLAHAHFFLGPDPPTEVLSQGGRCGVGFFFVLSGAILAYNYSGEFSNRRFLLKRFARIYPVYLLAFGIGLVARAAVDHGIGFLSPELVLKNLLMVPGWFADGNSQTVPATAWTLSCELLFYLLFPLVLPLLRRIPARAAGVAIAVLVLASFAGPGLLYEHVIDTAFYLSPVVYLPLFVLGCLIGLHLPRMVSDPQGFLRRNSRGLLVGSAVGVVAAWAGMTLLPEWPDLFVFVWPVLIAAGAAADVNGPHWLSSRWLIYGGLWSYAFYSVHAPLINIVTGVLNDPPPIAVGVPIGIAMFAGIWAVSALIFRFWEEPCRERITKRRPKEVAVLGDTKPAVSEPA